MELAGSTFALDAVSRASGFRQAHVDPGWRAQGASETAVWSLAASSKGMLWTSLPVNVELECCPAGLGAQSILPSGMTRLRSTIFGGTRSTTNWRAILLVIGVRLEFGRLGVDGH